MSTAHSLVQSIHKHKYLDVRRWNMFSAEKIQQIRNELHNIERSGTLPSQLLQDIYAKRLFKLFVPDELGGRLTPLPDALNIFQLAASIDGSYGWLITIGSGGEMFAPYMKTNVMKEYFSPVNAVVAGSGYPAGVAQKTAGGYLVNGTWKYCSGAQYATMFTANCLVIDNDKNELVLSFIFEPNEITILHDWEAFGLKDTGSHTISAKDVFIPDERTFTMLEKKNKINHPIYSFPFMQFSEASFTVVCLGIGEHFIEEATAIAKRNEDVWDSHRYSFVMSRIKEQADLLKHTTALFYEQITQAWNIHVKGMALSKELLENVTNICKHSVSTTIHCANHIIRYLGMEAVMETSTINRIWRDLYTAGQHAFLIPYQQEENS